MHTNYTNKLWTSFALHFLELVHKINPKMPEKKKIQQQNVHFEQQI